MRAAMTAVAVAGTVGALLGGCAAGGDDRSPADAACAQVHEEHTELVQDAAGTARSGTIERVRALNLSDAQLIVANQSCFDGFTVDEALGYVENELAGLNG